MKSFEEGLSIVKRVPETIRWRIFILFRGKLPDDRYYTVESLFTAPEPTTLTQRLGSAAEDGSGGRQPGPSSLTGNASRLGSDSAEADLNQLTHLLAEALKKK